ncbi:MAG TPA: hypothetical protein DCZ95_13055 [Verrucomicrobia bacterium]|nr:MAG: hypothetical protein A2X46_11605 [Lentisphaerae bacterium GWF2_57_35]HBA85016.1 hypothetical protein [Verrucomicrobiota bacterium]
MNEAFLVERILLVDDDPPFQDGLSRLIHGALKPMNPEILRAGDGAQALDCLAKQPVDLVFLDYQMPGMSGLECLQHALEKQPALAVIMVTGAGDEHIAVEAMKAGAMDYLVKGSITTEAFRRSTANALHKRALMQTIEKQQAELLDAERQRVMIESLGAACHHLGQPATVIRLYLELIQREELSPHLKEMVLQCVQAADRVADILQRLQELNGYRPVPYLKSALNEKGDASNNIVDVP